MRKAILAALGLILLLAVPGSAQEPSVAEAARKAREKKKDAPKATKVFTNDNIASSGGQVSVVGSGSTEAPKDAAAGDKSGGKKAEGGAAKDGEKDSAKEEAMWRKRFAEIRTKIAQAEKEIDILQRELNLKQQQYYSDPNKALREQYNRKDINDTRKKIDDKKVELQQLRQQLTDLEDELRRAGGPPAWSRE